jgi:hypothetical protein
MDSNENTPAPNRTNESADAGTNGANGAGPMPGPEPIPVTPEIKEWMLRQFDDETAAADLREIMATGGVSFEELLRYIEEVAGADD